MRSPSTGERLQAIVLALLMAALLGCAGPAATLPPIPTATLPAPTAAHTALPPASSLPSAPVPTSTLVPAAATLPPTPVPPTEAPTPPVPAAGEILSTLSDTIGPRVAGTEGEARAAEYIAGVLEAAGYAPATQPFDFIRASRQVRLESANVVAIKPGRSERLIVVGAHYDSVDVGRGADDNASGVAVMLDVAARVRALETPYTIHFVAFGAEEMGWHGSYHYVVQLGEAGVESVVVMVDLDSLAAGDLCYVYGDEGSRGAARDWLLDWAQREGVALQTQPGENPDYPAGTTGDWSDHVPFKEAGIPYAYFEATNWNLGKKDGWTQVPVSLGEEGEIWHTKYDSLRTLEEIFPGRIAEHLEIFGAALYALLTEYEE